MNNEDDSTKYCVVAYMDLLGFSSHLEVGSNDIRTKIGNDAIVRIKNLDDYMKLANKQIMQYAMFNPENMHSVRINDSIILSIDLPDELAPDVGQIVKPNFIDEWTGFLSKDVTEDNIDVSFDTEICSYIENLVLFIGLVARLHFGINEKENHSFFPGIKTVISTGFRKEYQTESENSSEFLSANFAFANASIAEKELHGPCLYVEESIMRLISLSEYGMNIIRFSTCFNDKKIFDPFLDINKVYGQFSNTRESTKVMIKILRKDYSFWELNPIRLAYLSFNKEIKKYIESPHEFNGTGMFKDIFDHLAVLQKKEDIVDKFLYIDIMILSIDYNIDDMFNILVGKRY